MVRTLKAGTVAELLFCQAGMFPIHRAPSYRPMVTRVVLLTLLLALVVAVEGPSLLWVNFLLLMLGVEMVELPLFSMGTRVLGVAVVEVVLPFIIISFRVAFSQEGMVEMVEKMVVQVLLSTLILTLGI